jgi:hypothetical protein
MHIEVHTNCFFFPCLHFAHTLAGQFITEKICSLDKINEFYASFIIITK